MYKTNVAHEDLKLKNVYKKSENVVIEVLTLFYVRMLFLSTLEHCLFALRNKFGFTRAVFTIQTFLVRDVF